MADTVTISKSYFDTLLRRSQTRADGTVTISQTDFDFLLKSTQEYTTLRNTLLQGGVDAATLDVLIRDSYADTASPKKPSKLPSPVKPRPQIWSASAVPFVPKSRQDILPAAQTYLKTRSCDGRKWQLPSPGSTNPDDFEELNYDDISPVTENRQFANGQDHNEEAFYDNREDRSLVLMGISPFTTLAEVLAVIRGGVVLNIYLRPQHRVAHVAFVDPIAAEKFLIHSKRTDIYVKGKRIEVFWDDRQHFLQGHLARRIYSNGATRNLVIRFAKADMTEQSIRDDLEHIHNLEVVNIHFKFNHAWVSLNNIQQAVTARSCMSSRLRYRDTRIEFYQDECAEPLPPYVGRQPKSQPATLRSKSNFNNKFAALAIDDNSSTGFGSPTGKI